MQPSDHRTNVPCLTQPAAMRTKSYLCGVERVNGNDAWSLFKASAAGDGEAVANLLAKDRRLVNAQFWYQLPIHFAVGAGDNRIVKQLLARGADPGQSRFLYNSWDRLLGIARERAYDDVVATLEKAMVRKFQYAADFHSLKAAIVARNQRQINTVLRRRPGLARASDALGNNGLHCSVVTRNLGMIERFVALGVPLDAQRADGQTALLLAINQACDYWYRGARNRDSPALRNAWVMVGDLLARGARYTMSAAAAVGDQERVEQLLRRDAGAVNQLDSNRVSPLSYAAREGHAHIVRLLLDRGADPNQPEDLASEGRALFEACGGDHLEVATLLLEHGANPNAGVDSCGCCLTVAAHLRRGKAKPLQKLLRRYGAVSPSYAMTVSQMKQAIRNGDSVVRDVEFLGRVIAKKDPAMLDMLLDADPLVPGRLQPLIGCTYPRSPALIQRLLDHGLDVNRTDWLGRTMLHSAAGNGDRVAAKMFLEAGADLNARDFEFKGTPLAAAVRAAPCGDNGERSRLADRQQRMVTFLLGRGAVTDLPADEPWSTPVAWARKNGLTEIESILRAHGAAG